jgi:hypothetical protein
VGSTLRVTVTAANNAGASLAVSAPTAPISAAPASTPQFQTLTFTGSLTPKNGSRSFAVAVGAGRTHSELAFGKCSSLNLDLFAGTLAKGSAHGPSVVTLDADLPAGSYTYNVGGGRCSFTLTVTAPKP